MGWRKLGRIFKSEGQLPWMSSHAGLPIAELIEGNLFRIYFTSRDHQGRSHVGWFEIDITQPCEVLRFSQSPLLSPGAPGRFDDAGVTLSCLIQHGGVRHFYYIGWSLRCTVPYHLAIGLAHGPSNGDPPVANPLSGPIVERNPVDPLFCTAPTVLVEDGLWRMWYVSGIGWPSVPNGVTPSYNTRYAESNDGVEWRRNGLVVLDPGPEEFGFSRPSIIRDDDDYLMWFSSRGRNQPYKLGTARSSDGLKWIRDYGDAGLDVSPHGWDSEMIAYPHVFCHRGNRYMLYCGNGFGAGGIGLAVWE